MSRVIAGERILLLDILSVAKAFDFHRFRLRAQTGGDGQSDRIERDQFEGRAERTANAFLDPAIPGQFRIGHCQAFTYRRRALLTGSKNSNIRNRQFEARADVLCEWRKNRRQS